MTVIGITGPTGAGKTTALHALEQLGAVVLDADRVYHRLLAESPAMQTALVQAFGPDILDGDGAIDRKRLAGAVYPDRLEELNRELGATILMVTHDAFTASCCRRVVFLQDGQIFLELHRGSDSRKAFFQKIIRVVTEMGGGMADVL